MSPPGFISERQMREYYFDQLFVRDGYIKTLFQQIITRHNFPSECRDFQQITNFQSRNYRRTGNNYDQRGLPQENFQPRDYRSLNEYNGQRNWQHYNDNNFGKWWNFGQTYSQYQFSDFRQNMERYDQRRNYPQDNNQNFKSRRVFKDGMVLIKNSFCRQPEQSPFYSYQNKSFQRDTYRPRYNHWNQHQKENNSMATLGVSSKIRKRNEQSGNWRSRYNKSSYCSICKLSFTTKTQMKKHKRSGKHREKVLSLSVSQMFSTRKKFRKRWRRRIKNKLQKEETPVILKSEDKSKEEASSSSVQFLKGISSHSTPMAETGVFQCPNCPKQFETKGGLISHSQVHTPVITYFVCDHCKVKFVSQTQLTFHISQVHIEVKVENDNLMSENKNTET